MNGLLCCAEILGVLLFIPWCFSQSTTSDQDVTFLGAAANTPPDNLINAQKTSISTPLAVSKIPHSPSTYQRVQTTTLATTFTTTSSPWTIWLLMNNYPKLLIICAVLILACTILLISTLALAVKVCQLRRHLKASSEYWMGMDKTNKCESQPEAKENCFLLTENGQTNQEIDNGANKEDGKKVGEDVQNGEEKKVEDAKESEEAATPAAPEESSPSSKPEEETSISETTIAPPPPSSSEDTVEPKKEP